MSKLSAKVNAGRHSSTTCPLFEIAFLHVPALPFSLFCRTIASQHRPFARLAVPADEGKNRSSGGEHLSVGGEQQSSQSRLRDWQWARRERRNRQLAARVQRSSGDAVWAPTLIQPGHTTQSGMGEAGSSEYQRRGTQAAESCGASHGEKRLASSIAVEGHHVHGPYHPFRRRHRRARPTPVLEGQATDSARTRETPGCRRSQRPSRCGLRVSPVRRNSQKGA